VPYALCYRQLLEECSTIAEAKSMLEKMHRTTITNLVLADRNNVAVLEVTPRAIVARAPEAGVCVCTNHFCSKQLKPVVPLPIYRTFDRYQILERASAAREKLSPADLHLAMFQACQEDETLQTMVFEPARLRLHLAIGSCPAAASPMKTLDLGPLLRSQPK